MKKSNSELPIKKDSGIIERIKEFFEKKRSIRFYKYAQGNTQKDREKALKEWIKMSDNSKIEFIMSYTTTAWMRAYDIAAGNFPNYEFYRKEFSEQLIEDLWKSSNYNVQEQTFYNEQPINYSISHTININTQVVDRNWKHTDPKLQKEILEKIINAERTDGTLMWRAGIYGGSALNKDYTAYMHKFRNILDKIEETNLTVLLEMYDSIMQFLDNEYVTNEMLKEFAQKLPENVKREKVDTTFDYAVRDDKLFAEKWKNLSYEEKIASLKDIFSNSIYEHTLRTRPGEETSIIRRMYPCYYRVLDEKHPLVGESLISYDPKVIKRIIGDMRGYDLDKYLCDIMGQKKANPFTIYCIWDSLDRRAQIKYYDQVMDILEECPESQYKLWIATKANSKNQRKKQEIALPQIQTIEGIQAIKGRMRFLIKGVSGDGQSGKKINQDVKSEELMPTTEGRD